MAATRLRPYKRKGLKIEIMILYEKIIVIKFTASLQ